MVVVEEILMVQTEVLEVVELGVNQEQVQPDQVTYLPQLPLKEMMQDQESVPEAEALAALGETVIQDVEVSEHKTILQDQAHITQAVEQVPEITRWVSEAKVVAETVLLVEDQVSQELQLLLEQQTQAVAEEEVQETSLQLVVH